MEIRADRRCLKAEDASDAIAQFDSASAAGLESTLVKARAFRQIELSQAYLLHGCGSAIQFGCRYGHAAAEVWELSRLGGVLEAEPEIEKRLRARTLSVPAAAALAPIFAHPELSKQSAQWIERAESERLRELRRSVKRALVRARTGQLVVDLTLHVTESAADDFERARRLESGRQRRFLSQSETFERVVGHFLETFDPDRNGEGTGTRRVPDTSTRPDDRYIPASVKRAIRQRSGGCCEFPGCKNQLSLQFAHWRPHCDASPREACDLLLLCPSHHVMVDSGYYWKLGTPLDPVFVGPDGLVYDRSAPNGRPPAVAEERLALQRLQSASAQPPDRGEGGANSTEDRTAATVTESEGCTRAGSDSPYDTTSGSPERGPMGVAEMIPAYEVRAPAPGGCRDPPTRRSARNYNSVARRFRTATSCRDSTSPPSHAFSVRFMTDARAFWAASSLA